MTEVRKYVGSLEEAKRLESLKEYTDTADSKFNRIDYDIDKDSWFVSYICTK